MLSLRDLEVFVAIAEAGSLTAAAERLGRSLQAVSRSLQSLEAEVGATLIARTTRSLRLTPAGERFRERLQDVFAELEAARAEVAEETSHLRGTLRVSAATQFGPAYVVPLVSEFLTRHPGLGAALDFDDEYRDPVKGGADVTIRIGDTPDSRLVARRLASVRRVVFASPEYLERHGRPLAPADLVAHECVIRSNAAHPRLWRFQSPEQGEIAVSVKGRIEANHADAVNRAVACGMGIGIATLWQIRPLLEAGKVERLLSAFEPTPVPLNALWVRAPRLPARTRQFIDFLAERFADEWL
ncbi:LysR family transcriptional regulator [Pandoraea thiooxydans]|uniref:LysR family transcriptional regulator n=1 Tax=Pandoraea thiooxydans TaxID=445709 RepID=A0A0G3ESH3_9BURK|nr:LysR family transcriptional regulator [Pandoraea thiooxydans]AKJ67656.1 LysR family transcriptional regulator [Pandoraea thiooxydans]APR94772.1 LysR family transcriptional regulator [Pandoraea thiooxydans]